MPAETIIAPEKSTGTVTLDAPEVREARPPGAPRARNEYPEAYDELEAIDAPAKESVKSAPAKSASTEKSEAVNTGRDESGRFLPRQNGGEGEAKAPKDETKAADGEAKAGESEAKAPAGETPDAKPDPTAKFQLAHDLRKAFRKLHQEHDILKGELTTLRAKSQTKPPVDEGETKTLRERLKAAEEEIRYLDYSKSDEFKERHVKPYQQAFARAVEEIEELQVLDENGAPQRPATERDFQKILTADKSEVKALARRLFGEDAGEVLALRRKLNDMNGEANNAARGYREKAAERERQRALKTAEERDGMERLWKAKVGEVAERYKQFFGKIEGDDEYNEALEEGYKRIDAAHTPDLPMEERVTRLAVVRHKAAAFGAQVLVNKRLKARVKELEEALTEYEKSVPAGGKGGKDAKAGGEANGYKSADEELEELERKNPGER